MHGKNLGFTICLLWIKGFRLFPTYCYSGLRFIDLLPDSFTKFGKFFYIWYPYSYYIPSPLVDFKRCDIYISNA